MHATAKNPASRSSSNASLSIFLFSKTGNRTLELEKHRCTHRLGILQPTGTGHPQNSCEATARQASTAQCLVFGSLRRGKERTNCATYNLWWILWSGTMKVKFKLFMNLIHNL